MMSESEARYAIHTVGETSLVSVNAGSPLPYILTAGCSCGWASTGHSALTVPTVHFMAGHDVRMSVQYYAGSCKETMEIGSL